MTGAIGLSADVSLSADFNEPRDRDRTIVSPQPSFNSLTDEAMCEVIAMFGKANGGRVTFDPSGEGQPSCDPFLQFVDAFIAGNPGCIVDSFIDAGGFIDLQAA